MAFYNGDTDSDTVVAIQYTSICFSHDITERKELMHSNVILSSFQWTGINLFSLLKLNYGFWLISNL